MRQIAYKIADNTRVAASLPSGWIVEHTYVDMQPEGSLGNEWIIVDEDQFESIKAQSNSDEKMEAFKAEQKAQQEAMLAELEIISQEARAKEEALKAEFAQFVAWKKAQK